MTGGATATILAAGYFGGEDVLTTTGRSATRSPQLSAATGVLTLTAAAPADYQAALRR